MTTVPIDCNNFFVTLMLGVLLAAVPTASYSSETTTELRISRNVTADFASS